MGNKKLLFFDIDGTIWDYHNIIPDSALLAFKKLKEKGHELFISTGRAKSHIKTDLFMEIGFDGVVSACGACIDYRGSEIFARYVDPKILGWAVEVTRQFGMRPILEGTKYLYLDLEEWDGDPYYFKLKREMDEGIVPIKDFWGRWDDVCKFSCDTTDCDTPGCYEVLKEHFDFIPHNINVVEVVPKGYSKATGISYLCEYLNIPIEDTFAFGDSRNDEEMIGAVNTGIAMGNASDDLKALADYVTTGLKEDGIYNACLHFGLIDES